MSIINDALKKTQKNLDNKNEPDVSKLYDKLYHPKGQQSDSPDSTASTKPDNKPAGQTKKNRKSLLLLLVILIVFGGVLLNSYSHLLNQSSLAKYKRMFKFKVVRIQPPPPSPVRKYDKDTLVLNGTVFEASKKAALINDTIYEIGDFVGGKKITNITSKKVELTDGAGVITTLSTP